MVTISGRSDRDRSGEWEEKKRETREGQQHRRGKEKIRRAVR